MKVADAIEYAIEQIGGVDPEIDARYLLSFILKKDFTWLKTWPEAPLSPSQKKNLLQLAAKRKAGEPIAYITGEKDFWSLTLETNPSTLIPRPETELLVETSLAFLSTKPEVKVLDLGTGTGAIALAIASERPNDTIIASDYVFDAVQLAKKNALKNKIKNVKIVQSDWFDNIDDRKFDLIVSNPPYVDGRDPHLLEGDLRFEPVSALVSGEKGFTDLETIIKKARDFLTDGGMLMLEHGSEQAEKLREKLTEFGYVDVETVQDLSGLDRITQGRNSLGKVPRT